MRLILIFAVLLIVACSENNNTKQKVNANESKVDLVAILDTIWRTEQTPIRMRDSLMKAHGVDSPEAAKYQTIYKRNHLTNEKKIKAILEKQGWPKVEVIGEQGNLTICNVLQHADVEVRLKYLPLMKEAVKEKKLQPRLLARAEDRLATDRGDLQVYGGQIKYYPETKTFDVWPIIDPENVDQRRAEIGLVPIAEFLNGRRTPMKWDLDEQKKRTADFIKNKEK